MTSSVTMTTITATAVATTTTTTTTTMMSSLCSYVLWLNYVPVGCECVYSVRTLVVLSQRDSHVELPVPGRCQAGARPVPG